MLKCNVFCTNFLWKLKNGQKNVLFWNFLKSLCKNATFVTDSSQNLSNTRKFCDHKKIFENHIFWKNGLGTFFVSILYRMTYAKSTKKYQKYHCEECDYNTSKHSLWLRHISTQKHKILTNTYIKNVHFHFCECGKKYKHSSSYCNHKKNCNFNNLEAFL